MAIAQHFNPPFLLKPVMATQLTTRNLTKSEEMRMVGNTKRKKEELEFDGSRSPDCQTFEPQFLEAFPYSLPIPEQMVATSVEFGSERMFHGIDERTTVLSNQVVPKSETY